MGDWPDITNTILGTAMGTFGTPFTITPDGGQPETLRGVFDDEHEEVDLDVTGDSVLSTHSPRIGIRLSDFSQEPKQNDEIQRLGLCYRIVDIQQDGQGGAVLHLHEVSND